MHLDYIIGNEDTGYGGVLRSYLDEPVDVPSDWENSELLDYVNLEHRHLFSVQRNYNEDWFGRVYVTPFVANQYEYALPMDCVTPRRVEILNAAGIGGAAPNFTVNEITANAQEVGELNLNDKSSALRFTSNMGFRFGTGYYLFDDTIVFEPNQSITDQYYLRIYYSPQAPDLHRGVAQAGGAATITLADNIAATTLGRVRNIDNYYQKMRVEIISGTGIGQLKRIVSYAGATQIATVDSNWTTVPDNTSVYSIVSPIQEDYQELLILGGALRAKGIKIEDDTSGIGAIYTALRSDMDNALEHRNHQTNRRVNTTQGRISWF